MPCSPLNTGGFPNLKAQQWRLQAARPKAGTKGHSHMGLLPFDPGRWAQGLGRWPWVAECTVLLLNMGT